MARPIDFKPNAIPICLPRPYESFNGQTGFATGWGDFFHEESSGRSNPKILREVQLSIINPVSITHSIFDYKSSIPLLVMVPKRISIFSSSFLVDAFSFCVKQSLYAYITFFGHNCPFFFLFDYCRFLFQFGFKINIDFIPNALY